MEIKIRKYTVLGSAFVDIELTTPKKPTVESFIEIVQAWGKAVEDIPRQNGPNNIWTNGLDVFVFNKPTSLVKLFGQLLEAVQARIDKDCFRFYEGIYSVTLHHFVMFR